MFTPFGKSSIVLLSPAREPYSLEDIRSVPKEMVRIKGGTKVTYMGHEVVSLNMEQESHGSTEEG